MASIPTVDISPVAVRATLIKLRKFRSSLNMAGMDQSEALIVDTVSQMSAMVIRIDELEREIGEAKP